MVASNGDTKGALGDCLIFDFVEETLTAPRSIFLFYNILGERSGDSLVFKDKEELGKIVDADEFDAFDERGLLEVVRGEKDFFVTETLSSFDDIDNTMNGAERALERKFADENPVFDVGIDKLLGDKQNRKGDRQIKIGAVFVEVGGSEIDGNLVDGEGETGVGQGATDAVSSFVDGLVGHADDIEGREAMVFIALNFDESSRKTGRDYGIHFYNHDFIVIQILKNLQS